MGAATAWTVVGTGAATVGAAWIGAACTTGAGVGATGAGAATLLDSSLAVRATTAAVRASILSSSDIKFLQFTDYRGLDCETIFNERLDDFTMHFARGADLLCFVMKLGARLVCHSDSHER
jgi:hypothetical protein